MAKKSVAKEPTHEEKLQRFIESECRYIPDPPERCKYNIGDNIDIGMLKNVKIIGIYHDYKVYEIEYSSTNNNYGNPIITHGHTRFVPVRANMI